MIHWKYKQIYYAKNVLCRLKYGENLHLLISPIHISYFTVSRERHATENSVGNACTPLSLTLGLGLGEGERERLKKSLTFCSYHNYCSNSATKFKRWLT